MLKTKFKVLLILGIILISALVFGVNNVQAYDPDYDFTYVWVAKGSAPTDELMYAGSGFDTSNENLYVLGSLIPYSPSDLYVYIASKTKVGDSIPTNKGNLVYDGQYNMYSNTWHVYKLPLSNVLDSTRVNNQSFTFDFTSSNGVTRKHTIYIENYAYYGLPESRETIQSEGATNNISINGAFIPHGSDFGVETTIIDKNDDIYAEMVEKLSNNYLVLSIYNIEVVGGGYEGELVITFTVGTEYNGRNASVLHKKQDGSIEIFNTVVVDGKITVTVTELSPFMIALENTGNDRELDDEPKAGANNYIVLASALTVVSLFGIAVLKFKK